MRRIQSFSKGSVCMAHVVAFNSSWLLCYSLFHVYVWGSEITCTQFWMRYPLVGEHTWGVSGSTFMSLGGKTNKLYCPERMKNTSSLPHLPGVQDKYKWAKKSIKQLQRNFLLPCSQNSMIANSLPNNWLIFKLKIISVIRCDKFDKYCNHAVLMNVLWNSFFVCIMLHTIV
jgi:hypothetical protein